MEFRPGLDKGFYKNVTRIAIPVALQSFLASTLNMIDTAMVGQIGENSIAAVGLCNQYFLVFAMLLYGITGTGGIFTAQFWGIEDYKNIKRILGITLLISLICSAIFALIGLILPYKVIGFFTSEKIIIALGADYLKIISYSYILMAITSCFSSSLRSVGQVKLPVLVNLIAIITNTVLNYLLITGNHGFPALGVKGAALASLIARIIETIILISFVYIKKYNNAATIKELTSFTKQLVSRFINKAVSITLKDLIWVFGTVAYTKVYSSMGIEVLASINITNTIQNISFFLLNGLGNAALIMIGKEIGKNDIDKAYNYSKRFIKLTLFISFGISVFIFSTKDFILSFFNVSDNVIMFSNNIVIVISLTFVFRAFNNIAIIGIFRSGGDTKFPLYLDTVAVWLIGYPLAIITSKYLGLSISMVFFSISLQEIFKMVFCVYRFKSKKWVNNLVIDI